MTIDHLSVAGLIGKFLRKDKLIASVTEAQVVGTRNPTATFTIIGNNGAVLQVTIKRLMRGQEAEPPKPTAKPKAPRPAAKGKASKK